MSGRAVFRYAIEVNGQPSTFGMTGDPLAVAAAGEDRVEFWAEHNDVAPERNRAFQVFGTGHPVPDDAVYVGTAQRTALGLVWHLFEVPE